jgi:glycosyltransferase involved in cell wall biosynthesis
MRVAIVADTFPPLRTSGAIQLRDLALEMAKLGHDVTVFVSDPLIKSWTFQEDFCGVTVIRCKTPQTKDINYLRRFFGELFMAPAMIVSNIISGRSLKQFDTVIWYSPSIFLGPMVRWIKGRSDCKSYLILRDIFPQWAADMGLIGRGPLFRFLDSIARYQYRSATVIGVQSPGNIAFFDDGSRSSNYRIEVLHNWLAGAPEHDCSIDVQRTKLAGRKIFVYAGNMGVAQQMEKLLDLAIAVRNRDDVGFLFVGRGSETQRLRDIALQNGLGNVHFEDEIDPDEISALYRQCHVGMICLDPRHRTHNIPGKFLSYLKSGLPVLASINSGNDLQSLVEQHGVGRVSTDPVGGDLPDLVADLIANEIEDPQMGERCIALAENIFSARAAASQILKAMST